MGDEETATANFEQTLEDIRLIDEVLESEDDDYDGSDLEIDERRETDDDLSGVPSIRLEAFSPKPLSTISSSLGDVPGSLAGLEVESDTDVDVSKEQLLFLNQQYQEYVAANLARVRKALERNRELQNSKLNAKRKDSSSLVFTQFTTPYFKDDNRLNPPENDDTKAIRQFGYPMPTNPGSSKTWSKLDLEALKEGVKADGLERIMAPLLNQREVFEKRLRKAIDDADRVSRKELVQEIREIDKELFNLKKLPEADVLGDKVREVDWTKVAIRHLNGTRREWECQVRWQNDAHPSIRHDWTAEDDQRLEEVAAAMKYIDWAAIARELGTGHSAFECLQRYQQKLNFNLFRREYSPAEDNLITELVNKFRIGKFVPWMKVAYFLQDRKPCQIAWRWENKLDPTLKSGKWSKPEDELLKQIVARQKEDVVWVKVAMEIEGRTALQCRNRWKNCLSPHIRKGRFSASEDLILLEAVQKCGIGHWSKVSALLEKDERFTSGRNHSMLYHRYRYLANKQISKERMHFAELKQRERQKILEAEMTSIAGDSRTTLVGYTETQTFEDYLKGMAMPIFLEGIMKEVKEKMAVLGENARTHNISETTGLWYRCHKYRPGQGGTPEDNARVGGDSDVAQPPNSTAEETPSLPLEVTRKHRSAANYMPDDQWRPSKEGVTLMTQLTKAVFPSTTLKPNAFFARNNKVMRGRNRSDIVLRAINTEEPVNWTTAMSLLLMAVGVDFVACRGILYRDGRLPNITFLGQPKSRRAPSSRLINTKPPCKLAPAVGGARNNKPFQLVLDNPDNPGVGELVTGSIIGHLPAPKKVDAPSADSSKTGPAGGGAFYVVKTENGRILLVSAAQGSQQPQQPGERNILPRATGSDQLQDSDIPITVEPVNPDDSGGTRRVTRKPRTLQRKPKVRKKPDYSMLRDQQKLIYNKKRRLALQSSRHPPPGGPGGEGVAPKGESAPGELLENGSSILTTPPVSGTSDDSGSFPPPALSSDTSTSDLMRIEKVNTLASCPDSITGCTGPLVTTISDREMTQMHQQQLTTVGGTLFPRVGSGVIIKPKPKPKGPKLPRYCGDNAKIVVSVARPSGHQAVVMYKPLMEKEASAEHGLLGNEANNNIAKSADVVPEGESRDEGADASIREADIIRLDVVSDGVIRNGQADASVREADNIRMDVVSDGVIRNGQADASVRDPDSVRVMPGGVIREGQADASVVEADSMSMYATNGLSSTGPKKSADHINGGSDEQAISLLMACTGGTSIGYDSDDVGATAESSQGTGDPRKASEDVETHRDRLGHALVDEYGSKHDGKGKGSGRGQRRENTDMKSDATAGAAGIDESVSVTCCDENQSVVADQQGGADGSSVNGETGGLSNDDGGGIRINGDQRGVVDSEGVQDSQNTPALRERNRSTSDQRDTTKDPAVSSLLSTKRASRKRKKKEANEYAPPIKKMPLRAQSTRKAAPKIGHFVELLADDDDSPEPGIGEDGSCTASSEHSTGCIRPETRHMAPFPGVSSDILPQPSSLVAFCRGLNQGTNLKPVEVEPRIPPGTVIHKMTALGAPLQIPKAQSNVSPLGQPQGTDITVGSNTKIVLGPDGAVLGFVVDKPQSNSAAAQHSNDLLLPDGAKRPPPPNVVESASATANPNSEVKQLAPKPPSVKSLISLLRASRSSISNSPTSTAVPDPAANRALSPAQDSERSSPDLVDYFSREPIREGDSPLDQVPGGGLTTASLLPQITDALNGLGQMTQVAVPPCGMPASNPPGPVISIPVTQGSHQVAIPGTLATPSLPHQLQSFGHAVSGIGSASSGVLNNLDLQPFLALNNQQQLTVILRPPSHPQGKFILPKPGSVSTPPVLPSPVTVVNSKQSPEDAGANNLFSGGFVPPAPGTPVSVTRNQEHSASSAIPPNVARLLNSPAFKLGGPIMIDGTVTQPSGGVALEKHCELSETLHPPTDHQGLVQQPSSEVVTEVIGRPPTTTLSPTRHQKPPPQSAQESPCRTASTKPALNLVSRSPWRSIPAGKRPSTPKSLSETVKPGPQKMQSNRKSVPSLLGKRSGSMNILSMATAVSNREAELANQTPLPNEAVSNTPTQAFVPAVSVVPHQTSPACVLQLNQTRPTSPTLAVAINALAQRAVPLEAGTSTTPHGMAESRYAHSETVKPGPRKMQSNRKSVLSLLGKRSGTMNILSMATAVSNREAELASQTPLPSEAVSNTPPQAFVLTGSVVPHRTSPACVLHQNQTRPTLPTLAVVTNALAQRAVPLEGGNSTTPRGTAKSCYAQTPGQSHWGQAITTMAALERVQAPQGTVLTTPGQTPAPTVIQTADSSHHVRCAMLSVDLPPVDKQPEMDSLRQSHYPHDTRSKLVCTLEGSEQEETLGEPEDLPSGDDADPLTTDRAVQSEDRAFREPLPKSSKPETVKDKFKGQKPKKPLLPELMKEDRHTVDLEKLDRFASAILGTPRGEREMGHLPPNLSTLFSFKHLLIRKDTLEESAAMFHLSRNQFDNLMGEKGTFPGFKEEGGNQELVPREAFLSEVRQHPEYAIFKERFTFLYLWPAFLSLLQPYPKKAQQRFYMVPKKKYRLKRKHWRERAREEAARVREAAASGGGGTPGDLDGGSGRGVSQGTRTATRTTGEEMVIVDPEGDGGRGCEGSSSNGAVSRGVLPTLAEGMDKERSADGLSGALEEATREADGGGGPSGEKALDVEAGEARTAVLRMRRGPVSTKAKRPRKPKPQPTRRGTRKTPLRKNIPGQEDPGTVKADAGEK